MIRWRGVTIDRTEKTIKHGGKTLRFLRTKRTTHFRLACALILAGPIRKDALFHLLYGDDEHGGPDEGIKIIDIMFQQIKPKLAAIGLEIYADAAWYCHGKRYWAAPSHRRIIPQRKAGDAPQPERTEPDGSLHDAPAHNPRGVLVTESRPLRPQHPERPTW